MFTIVLSPYCLSPFLDLDDLLPVLPSLTSLVEEALLESGKTGRRTWPMVRSISSHLALSANRMRGCIAFSCVWLVSV